MLNLKQLNKIADVCIIMLAFVLGFEILFYHSVITNWLIDVVESAGVWSWIVLCLFQFLQVVVIPVPSAFITLTSMKMYPNQLWLLYFITLAVVLLGVVVTYFVGRKWGKKAVMWCAGDEEEYNKWQRVLKSKKTNTIYFITVLFPIFPDDVLCLIAGSIKMNFWWYLTCNVVGRAIGLATFMFVFQTISNSIISIIVMIVLLVALVVIKIILKRRLTRELSCDR
jgi:uncharacterized membrane protein YdjX (TVP38/TMEM64 family)